MTLTGQANNMTKFTYTPTVKVYDRKDFKTDKNIFNMVKASNIYAYDKDDKKFMKNFQSQYPTIKFDTSSIKNFVTSLFDFKILVPGDFAVKVPTKTTKKAAPKKRISGIKKGCICGIKKGIGGSLFQKFEDVAKETKFTLRGAKLGTFLKWMNRNSKEIFGRSITTLKWFTILDKYPQVMDAIASARIDTEPLEDEDEAKVEKYYAKVKK